MPPSIADSIADATRLLQHTGVPEPRREASSLLAYVLGADRGYVIAHASDALDEALHERFLKFVERRAAGEPLQYIVGHQEFFRLDFEVCRDVLIPRPETELLVEAALPLLDKIAAPLICDLGTGSGCIAVSLVHEHPREVAVAIDISERAISVARRNALKHAVGDRIHFVVSDGLSAMEPHARFDLVISNPPYVPQAAIAGLQREVRDYEPRDALSPGGDGLTLIRRLIAESLPVLRAGGYLLLEMGFDQREQVLQMIDERSWRLLEIFNDLQGIPRTIALQKK
jgi:release factor glutamine methyltransferase